MPVKLKILFLTVNFPPTVLPWLPLDEALQTLKNACRTRLRPRYQETNTLSDIRPARSHQVNSAPAAEPFRIFDTFADALKTHDQRILLLGEPGGGKSTTLLTAVQTACERCLNEKSAPIPVFDSVHTWQRGTTLSYWLLKPRQEDYPGLDFAKHGVFYLLDGLDELGGERPEDPDNPEGPKFDPRADFLQAVQSELKGNPVALTCRVEDFQQIRDQAALTGAVTLLPLEDDQVEKFLRGQEQTDLWETLQQEASHELLELVRTPLLLALLSSAAGDNATLPTDLSSMTQSAIFDFYIKQRFAHEQEKIRKAHLPSLPFDENTTRNCLGRLAAEMWKKYRNPEVTLTSEQCQFALKTASFTTFACKMHLLKQTGAGEVAFVHLKLRDYCAVPTLLIELGDEDAGVRWRAAEALCSIGEPAVPGLLVALGDEDSEVRSRGADALGEIGDAQAISGLQKARNDTKQYVRRTAEWALQQIRERSR